MINRPRLLWIIPLLTILVSPNSFADSENFRHNRRNFPTLSKTSVLGIDLILGDFFRHPDYQTILQVVKQRMKEYGYTTIAHPVPESIPLIVIVNCEAALQEAPSQEPLHHPWTKRESFIRPPCYISYTYEGRSFPWKNVGRIIYNEGVTATQELVEPSSLSPSEFILRFLTRYDFPLIIAAEWEQLSKLLSVLDDPNASWRTKKLVIRLLGELQDVNGFSPLVRALQQKPLVVEAAKSLGFYGLRAKPLLRGILREDPDPLNRAAAATGLGRIAAHSGDSGLTPLFLEIIQDPSTDTRVKTEVVWALGKAPDMRAFPVLKELETMIWTQPLNDPAIHQLRKAVDWSIREVKQGGHGDNF